MKSSIEFDYSEYDADYNIFSSVSSRSKVKSVYQAVIIPVFDDEVHVPSEWD
jgi:hypothetical protein